MASCKLLLGLTAPVLLLGWGSALAQSVPPPATAPSGVNESNQTRELESEIEQYPGPTDGVSGDGARAPVIPERMQTPKKRTEAARPHAATPAAPTREGASSSIDPSEVQRVFGSDARVIALGSLDAGSISKLQMRLMELGHYRGSVDGMVGPQTRAALESYARAQYALKQRLLKQDQLTTDLAEQLGVQDGARPSASPTSSGDLGPSIRDDASLLPPGGAPPPSMAPLPTPSSSPSSVPAPRSTPPANRPAPANNPAPANSPARERGSITPTTPPSP